MGAVLVLCNLQGDSVLSVWTFQNKFILGSPWILSTELHDTKVREDVMIKETAQSTAIIATD